MSKAAMAWARQQTIRDGAMKPILVELATLHMDGKPLFPSQSYLAEATGNSERTVREALRLLEHFEVISRTARSNGAGGRTSDSFVLAIGVPFTLPRKVISAARKQISNRRNLPVREANSQPAKSAGGPGERCRGIGDLGDYPCHVGTELSVGQYPRGGRPVLRLVAGDEAW